MNSPARRVIIRIIDGITESNDLIEALEKSLPSQCRAGRGSTPQEKIKALYECSDQIDFCKAVEEIVKNQVEDFIYGRGSSKLGKPAGRAMGRPVGPQAGPIDQQRPPFLKGDKALKEYFEGLDPSQVAADVARAILDEAGVC